MEAFSNRCKFSLSFIVYIYVPRDEGLKWWNYRIEVDSIAELPFEIAARPEAEK